ncbi:MAG: hypothetical protein EHM63_02440 [Actinobacteria bacterium]|nr:MAG: hypothetical protein EHM63_02440 [Actinomycetota bacterium]
MRPRPKRSSPPRRPAGPTPAPPWSPGSRGSSPQGTTTTDGLQLRGREEEEVPRHDEARSHRDRRQPERGDGRHPSRGREVPTRQGVSRARLGADR